MSGSTVSKSPGVPAQRAGEEAKYDAAAPENSALRIGARLPYGCA